MWDGGVPVRRMAEELGRGRGSVMKFAQRHRAWFPHRQARWTDGELALAAVMWAEGETAESISEATGRTVSAVYRQAKARRDLFPRRPREWTTGEATRGPEGLGSCKDTAKGQTWP